MRSKGIPALLAAPVIKIRCGREELSRQIVAMLLLKVLFPILLGIHLLAADRSRSSPRHTTEPHIIVIKTVSDTEMVLECTHKDHGVGRATWTKNGQDILSGSERVSISKSKGEMTIDPVSPKDEGIYRCNDGKPFELTSKHVY